MTFWSSIHSITDPLLHFIHSIFISRRGVRSTTVISLFISVLFYWCILHSMDTISSTDGGHSVHFDTISRGSTNLAFQGCSLPTNFLMRCILIHSMGLHSLMHSCSMFRNFIHSYILPMGGVLPCHQCSFSSASSTDGRAAIHRFWAWGGWVPLRFRSTIHSGIPTILPLYYDFYHSFSHSLIF